MMKSSGIFNASDNPLSELIIENITSEKTAEKRLGGIMQILEQAIKTDYAAQYF